MFEIEYDHRKYSIEFKSGHPLRWYHPGKTYPKTTQCTIRKYDLIIGVGEVVKHHIDADNPEYAMRASMKKALGNSNLQSHLWKELRTEMWEGLNEYLKLRNKKLKNE